MNSWHAMNVCKHWNVFVFLCFIVRETIFHSFLFYVGPHWWIRNTSCTYTNIEMFLLFSHVPIVKPHSTLFVFTWIPIDEFLTRDAALQTLKCYHFLWFIVHETIFHPFCISVISHWWILDTRCTCANFEMFLFFCGLSFVKPYFTHSDSMWVLIREFVTHDAPLQTLKCLYLFVVSR